MNSTVDFLDLYSSYSWRWIIEQLLESGKVQRQDIIDIVEPEDEIHTA